MQSIIQITALLMAVLAVSLMVSAILKKKTIAVVVWGIIAVACVAPFVHVAILAVM